MRIDAEEDMKHGFIKVAAVTPKIKVADPEYNASVCIEEIRSASQLPAPQPFLDGSCRRSTLECDSHSSSL